MLVEYPSHGWRKELAPERLQDLRCQTERDLPLGWRAHQRESLCGGLGVQQEGSHEGSHGEIRVPVSLGELEVAPEGNSEEETGMESSVGGEGNEGEKRGS